MFLYPGLWSICISLPRKTRSGILTDFLLLGEKKLCASSESVGPSCDSRIGAISSLAPFKQQLLPIAPAQLYFHRAAQTLPGDISKFENLTTIEADNNELTSLPSALASIPIYRLSLRRNSLSSLASVDNFLAPSSIAPPGSLPLSISIRELNLSSNSLGEVPASVFACRGLQVGGCVCFVSFAALDFLSVVGERMEWVGEVFKSFFGMCNYVCVDF